MRKLPKEFTTVTRTSKTLALILFLSFPFIGFMYGMKYQQAMDTVNRQIDEANLMVKRGPTPTPQTTSQKNYRDPDGIYSFQYPSNWKISVHNEDCGTHILFKLPIGEFAALSICGPNVKLPQTPEETAVSDAQYGKLISKKNIFVTNHPGIIQEFTVNSENVSSYNIYGYIGGVKKEYQIGAGKNDISLRTGTITVSVSLNNPDQKGEAKKAIDQILSTFTFTK